MERTHAIFAVLVLVGILFFAGCTSNGAQASQGGTIKNQQPAVAPAQTQKPSELKTAVCGNGIKEEGETADNCCKDAGCPATFKCDSKFENGSTESFCLKVDKAGTFEAGKIKKLTSDIGIEINKEASLIDIEKARSKLVEIDQYTTKLNQQGYTITTEEFMQKAIKARIDVKDLAIKRTNEINEANTDAQKIDIAKKQMEDIKNLIITLESLKSNYGSNLEEAEQVYEYDISQNIDSWKDTLKELQIAIAAYEKQTAPISIDLAIVTASASTRYVLNPVITISNEGDNDLENLVIDAELSRNGALVKSVSDALFLSGGSSIDSIAAGKTVKGYLNIMWYNDISSGTYTLKISARRGADAISLSSDSTTVTINDS